MQFLKGLWAWFDGKKTVIGAIVVLVLTRLQARGLEIDPIIILIADAVLGLGIAHRIVKEMPPKAAAALMLAMILPMTAACATSAQPTTIAQPQRVATAQETKANEVYMAVAGFRSRAKTHEGGLGADTDGGSYSGERTVEIPMLGEDGLPVVGPDGKVVMTRVSGRIGDIYIVYGGLDAHQEIQVPGTSTATQGANTNKTDTSNKKDQANPTNDVKPDIKVPLPGTPIVPAIPDVPPPPAPAPSAPGTPSGL